MTIPVLVEGMRVTCRSPVNGLRFGAPYIVLCVRQSDLFYGGKIIDVTDEAHRVPEGGRAGYFAWRFEPAAGR